MIDTSVISGLHCRARISDKRDAPVVFLVHGRAGNFEVMWAFRRCIPDSFHIIAPQAFLDDPIGGYSWWPINDGRNRAEILEAAQKLKAFIPASLSHYGILPQTSLAFGFSQGAGLLSVLLQDDPNLFAGIALLAGFVIQTDNTVRNPKTSIFVAHGSKDATVSIDKARQGATYLTGLGFAVEFHEDEVDHKVGATGMRKLKEWTKIFEN